MSVLPCARNGCQNVMCDRYSPTYGYICYGCFEELLSSQNLSIGQFMETEKGSLPESSWEKHVRDAFVEV